MTVQPLGDCAVVLPLGAAADRAGARRVRAVADRLRRHPPPGAIEVVPAFGNIAVFFGPDGPPGADAFDWRAHLAAPDPAEGVASPAEIELPVVYGGAEGPDLDEVARVAGLAAQEVIRRHAGAEYFVRAVGFSPGFPYLGGLPPELAVPRRATPRVRVPGGSVGIGASQTGVYPQTGPGGWNLIGRTARRLFDPQAEPPALLQVGDEVRFRPVAAAAFPERISGIDPTEEKGPGVRVRRAGPWTVVQDLGRLGWRGAGVVPGGAADAFSLRVANLAVGNPEDAAALEFTQAGPELEFPAGALVVSAGAEIEGLPWGRPVSVPAGGILRLGRVRGGYRGYLAVAGGIGVVPVLGGRGVDARGGFGGGPGRALQAGDWLPLAERTREPVSGWSLDPRLRPAVGGSVTVGVIPGREAGEFPGWERRVFRVGVQSDRMGLRLEGEPLVRAQVGEVESSPVIPGTVQVPPDGRPIVLLADAQTLGGYPQLGHVISDELPRLAQAGPGTEVRWEVVSVAEARARRAARERVLRVLGEGVAAKWR